MEFDSWRRRLNPNSTSDRVILEQLVTLHKNEKKYMIVEAIRLVEATYTAEWSSELDAEAKAGFESLLGITSNINWSDNRKMTVKVTGDTDIMVAFKKQDFSEQIELIKEMLE